MKPVSGRFEIFEMVHKRMKRYDASRNVSLDKIQKGNGL